MAVKVVLKHIKDENKISFEIPTDKVYANKINEVLESCEKNSNGYVSIEINRPYKPRTTGLNSQNNLTWKLITIIADEMGEDVKEVEHLAKMKALSKGYPFHTSKLSDEPIPESMTKINTVENSYLIDTLYEMVAFLGINLEPELVVEIEEDKAMIETALELGGGLF